MRWKYLSCASPLPKTAGDVCKIHPHPPVLEPGGGEGIGKCEEIRASSQDARRLLNVEEDVFHLGLCKGADPQEERKAPIIVSSSSIGHDLACCFRNAPTRENPALDTVFYSGGSRPSAKHRNGRPTFLLSLNGLQNVRVKINFSERSIYTAACSVTRRRSHYWADRPCYLRCPSYT